MPELKLKLSPTGALKANLSVAVNKPGEQPPDYKTPMMKIIDRSITEFEIPNGVVEIGRWAFAYCEKLKKITIPETVTTIRYGAFQECKQIDNVEIPDSVTMFDNACFNHCVNLKNIRLSSSIEKIGVDALTNTAIEELVIPKGIKSFGVTCFPLPLIKVTMPNTVTGAYRAFSKCTVLEFVILENGFNCSNLDLSASDKYSVETLVANFMALADRTGQTAYTLTIGSANIAKLSSEQLAIATDKNWTIS